MNARVQHLLTVSWGVRRHTGTRPQDHGRKKEEMAKTPPPKKEESQSRLSRLRIRVDSDERLL